MIATSFGMCSCSENLDSYKDKVLEHAAAELGTTQELLIKDLDLKIDSMSISYFLVEDSIFLLEQKYKEDVQEQEKLIASQNKYIEKLEKENKEMKKSSFSSMFKSMNNNLIKESRSYIEQANAKIKEITDAYQLDLERYQGRDKKEKIYNVFRYHISFKIPNLEIHQAEFEMDLFSPDGETYIKPAGTNIKEYIETKLLKGTTK